MLPVEDMMGTYELSKKEIEFIAEAISYACDCSPELLDCEAVVKLTEKLNPKPIKREGWMVVWPDGATSSVCPSQYSAEELNSGKGRVVKVTWEE